MIHDIVLGLVETYGTTNPFELCDHLDIKIIKYNLGNEIKGFFQRTKEEYEIIYINSQLNNYESKYICSHELGHAILHTNLSLGFFIENKFQIQSKYEVQADKFAAELILPDNLDCECKGMNYEQLSLYFRVPVELIKYKFFRAYAL